MSCRVCGHFQLETLLDGGPQPVCHRFVRSATEPEYTHPLTVALCPRCALVQLHSMAPVRELRPRFGWIQYLEPEAHLDGLVDRAVTAGRMDADTRILGITYKDGSTVDRFARATGWPSAILNSTDPDSIPLVSPGRQQPIDLGPDVVTSLVDAARAGRIAERPHPSLVVARHILEHTPDPVGFLRSLGLLAGRNGRVFIEVPDEARALETLDYSMPWEEHASYFTQATLERALTAAGLSPIAWWSHSHALEDSVAVLAEGSTTLPASTMPSASVDAERRRALAFASRWPLARRRVQDRLAGLAPDGQRAAMLGGGHRACVWINLMGASRWLDVVIDDDPNKQGLAMPGSRLPLRAFEALLDKDRRLCLLAVSRDAHAAILARSAEFLARGGRFLSIFPQSNRSSGQKPTLVEAIDALA